MLPDLKVLVLTQSWSFQLWFINILIEMTDLTKAPKWAHFHDRKPIGQDDQHSGTALYVEKLLVGNAQWFQESWMSINDGGSIFHFATKSNKLICDVNNEPANLNTYWRVQIWNHQYISLPNPFISIKIDNCLKYFSPKTKRKANGNQNVLS